MGDLTFSDYQKQVDDWIRTHGVRYFSELTNTAVLMEEVGEVARIMARRYGDQSAKSAGAEADLGDELADVLFVLCCLANQTGVDLTEAIKKNLTKKTNRDHQRHRRNPKLSRLDDAGEKTGSDSGAGLETSAPRGGDHEKNG